MTWKHPFEMQVRKDIGKKNIIFSKKKHNFFKDKYFDFAL